MLTLSPELRKAVEQAHGGSVYLVDPDTAQQYQLVPVSEATGKSTANGIEIAADVCGGDARIAGTRIPIWGLVQSRRLGMSDAELLRCYPRLQPTDLDNAWAYAEAHASEIERQIAENETA